MGDEESVLISRYVESRKAKGLRVCEVSDEEQEQLDAAWIAYLESLPDVTDAPQ